MIPHQERPGLFQVAADPVDRDLADGQPPALATLTPADRQLVVDEFDLMDIEADHLGEADSGGVEELEQGAVPQSAGRRDLGSVQQELHIGQAEDALGNLAWDSGKFEHQ